MENKIERREPREETGMLWVTYYIKYRIINGHAMRRDNTERITAKILIGFQIVRDQEADLSSDGRTK